MTRVFGVRAVALGLGWLGAASALRSGTAVARSAGWGPRGGSAAGPRPGACGA